MATDGPSSGQVGPNPIPSVSASANPRRNIQEVLEALVRSTNSSNVTLTELRKDVQAVQAHKFSKRGALILSGCFMFIILILVAGGFLLSNNSQWNNYTRCNSGNSLREAIINNNNDLITSVEALLPKTDTPGIEGLRADLQKKAEARFRPKECSKPGLL